LHAVGVVQGVDDVNWPLNCSCMGGRRGARYMFSAVLTFMGCGAQFPVVIEASTASHTRDSALVFFLVHQLYRRYEDAIPAVPVTEAEEKEADSDDDDEE
jgi:hypothetical protein